MAQLEVQRKPEDALKKARADLEEVNKTTMEEEGTERRHPEIESRFLRVYNTLINTRRLRDFATVNVRSRVVSIAKSRLKAAIDDLLRVIPEEESFIEIWNQGIGRQDVARYSRSRKPTDGAQASKSTLPDSEEFEAWYAKELKDKSMVPETKLERLWHLIAGENLPEDVWIVMKLLFAHTANFQPMDRLGRDFRGKEHGQYYRSSNEPIRDNNTKIIKKLTERARKGSTKQVINKDLFNLISDHGKVASNIEKMKFDMVAGRDWATYISSVGSRTGALGLIQNVFRTIRTGTALQSLHELKDESWGDAEKAEEAKLEEGLPPTVDPELLAPGSKESYHDFLLRDRAELVRQLTALIRDRYPGVSAEEAPKMRVVPIQSENHASLILHLDYPSYWIGKTYTEKEWREEFIECFNGAARDTLNSGVRITHRGSFGFLYPTASSVGGPVRIWPGLVPPDVFKKILIAALAKLDAKHFQSPAQPDSDMDIETESPDLEIETESPTLHVEALKAAVRYAQQVMAEPMVRQGPKALYDWTIARLSRNLAKANFLLQKAAKPSTASEEQHYLKSTLVIENLMEYSYFLESLNALPVSGKDVYPEYFQEKVLGPASSRDPMRSSTTTFYLDSGMQSITTAHLIAKRWIESKKVESEEGDGKKRKRQPEGEALKTIDIYSYFEYAMIDKTNLNLEVRNRDKTGFLGKVKFRKMVEKTFTEIPPAIIAADLNPVFTKPMATEEVVPYEDVFKRFAGKDNPNAVTVPIVDVTNATLDDVAALKLDKGYENFIVVESLSKHQQLGADKFTMGRLTVVGRPQFVKCAKFIADPIAAQAYDRLPAAYRQRMDEVFYGGAVATVSPKDRLQETTQRYAEFMRWMGFGEEWTRLGAMDEAETAIVLQQKLVAEALGSYKKETFKTEASKLNLEKAFQALPQVDQQRLHAELNKLFKSADMDMETPLQVPGDGLDKASTQGITNVGNTCYLAAALNLIAFSPPYRDLFAPRENDPHKDLRAMIHDVLDRIVAGELIEYEVMSALLVSLSRQGLLEAPNAQGAARGLHDQRDPVEVLEYLLNRFDVGRELQLEQRYRTQFSDKPTLQDGVDATQYTEFTEEGNFPEERHSDWILKLPISEANSLDQALEKYQQPERLEVTGVRGGQVFRGPGQRRISFPEQHIPPAITIQLLRWKTEGGRIVKEAREINIPPKLSLFGGTYRLTTVVYHLGKTMGAGHYTASTKGEAAWSYRDDQSVSRDSNAENRVKFGYLYTYVLQEP